jgi:hypothetical protein
MKTVGPQLSFRIGNRKRMKKSWVKGGTKENGRLPGI